MVITIPCENWRCRNVCNTNMTEVAQNFESLTNTIIRPIPVALCSTEAFISAREDAIQPPMDPSTSSTVAAFASILSDDVNRWIAGDSSAIDTSVQAGNTATTETSSITISSLIENGIMYTLAMILPWMGCGNLLDTHRRLTPSFFAATRERLLSQLTSLCERTGGQIRALADEHVIREIFASAMDIVLFIYAIGYIFLSMCQAYVHAAT